MPISVALLGFMLVGYFLGYKAAEDAIKAKRASGT